ncbi:hypothetical protein ABFS82_12G107500 [Erythranthe guttata]|uniref:non-specific lipid-transfer protein Cw18-like n=1 Tax=Erythranthe guttata TaxID=4155 RepID=UPI00064DCC3D|nr:PREDICTED: non-specific lipid-transfer protein Cw18-like [Erythranthe guttata]|eukprot:XP_012847455.1 PREDICTED: non-specific lipid-transfer protein Cw18-like [Erythranthe guttata]
MAKTTISLVFCLLGLILLGLAPSGKCDCLAAPVEALTPCGAYIAGSDNKPTRGCCTGAAAWDHYWDESMCRCYQNSPGRLQFKLNRDKMLSLQTECGLSPRFTAIVRCLFGP